MAEGNVTLLLARLTSYSEALDRHNLLVQRAFDKMQASYTHLRRVWGGDAAEEFFSHWDRTVDAFEKYIRGSQRIRETLDTRIAALRDADRPFGEGGPVPISAGRAAGEAIVQGAGTGGGDQGQGRARWRLGARVELSPNLRWNPQEHTLEADGLPRFDGSKTYGRSRIGGHDYFIRSGTGFPGVEARNDPQIKVNAVTPTHVEGHVAMILRVTGATEGTVVINRPDGPCGFCETGLRGVLPSGCSLTVIWPKGSKTYWGKAS